MKIKPHFMRKWHQSKKAPLWKQVLVIVLVIALPLFFYFIRAIQMQQVLQNENAQTKVDENLQNYHVGDVTP